MSFQLLKRRRCRDISSFPALTSFIISHSTLIYTRVYRIFEFKYARLLKSFLVFIFCVFFVRSFARIFFPLFFFFRGGARFYLACACDIIHTYFTLLLLSLVRRFLFVLYSYIHKDTNNFLHTDILTFT